MDKKAATAFVKIMVEDSFMRGPVTRDEVAEIWQEMDGEPDAPEWGGILVKSSLALALLGLVTLLGLLGWLMAIR